MSDLELKDDETLANERFDDEIVNDEAFADETFTEETFAEELVGEMMSASSSRYVNIKDKYEDAKSTAATLLVVGIVGLLVIIGNVTKVTDKIYKLPFDIKSQWMMYFVMTALFIIFTIIGIYYVVKTNEYKKFIGKEEDDYKKIYDFIDEELSMEDSGAGIDENTNEAEVYFKRTAYVKDVIMRKFEDVDEALVEKIVDERYDDIFKSEDEK